MFLSVSIFSCAPPNRAVVVERTTIDRSIEIDRLGGSLVRFVQPGDTLYSIAFAMDLDPNEVAAWNGIPDTGKLLVGQRIRLTEPIGFEAKPETIANSPTNKKIVVVPIDDNSSTESPIVNVEPLESHTQEIAAVETSQPARTTKQETKNSQQVLHSWAWPTDGRVIRRFSQSQGQQGIDIQGQAGQAIFATNPGEVVYVGNGLRGYGNLVIIKHNDNFLSAYAHNSEIFVREGDYVEGRQRIATIGTNRVKQTALHFQIRKNGRPVNPLTYLPEAG